MCRIRSIVHLIYLVFIEVHVPSQESDRCTDCDPVSTNLIEFWNVLIVWNVLLCISVYTHNNKYIFVPKAYM